MANKAVDFISYFLHPNLTSGGEYASRNTEYLIPHGFEILSKQNRKAAAISNAIKESLKKRTTISPSSLDDRYLSYVGYTWLQASKDATNKKAKLKIPSFTNFKQAGIAIYNTKDYYLIVNYKKGGAFKLFFKKSNKVVYDAGLQVKQGKKKYTSSLLTDKNKFMVGKDSLTVYGNLMNVKTKTLTPIPYMALRIFQTFLGRFEFIGLNLKKFLRELVITFNKPSKYKYSREILIGDKIRIEDAIPDSKPDEVIIGGKASYNYIPSSRYFQTSELNAEQFILTKDKIKNRTRFTREYGKKGNTAFNTTFI